ncbi:alpha/beta hydrolase [Burkholderia stagnalis]
MTATEIAAPGPAGPLRGTLLSPAENHAPVVLIIPGSGPTDRDGNGPNGLRASTCRLLAEGLASRGIATVRIDKQGMYGSASAVPDADDVTLDDYAADVHSWVTAIRRHTGAACVWVLGHSEGGLVGLVAARGAADICGLILVSTAGRPLGDVLREQLLANPANTPIIDNAMQVLKSLEAGERVSATRIDPALMPVFRPPVQRFLISELTRDPATLLAGYGKPALIVQGLRDIQVGADDAARLGQANPRAGLALIADANHVLKTVRTDDRSDNLATYGNPDLPLADGVVDAISTFVRQGPATHGG